MTVVVSIHDVHPSTVDEGRGLLRLVERRGLRATLLVVPGPWHGRAFADAATVRWLHEAVSRGHEIALHGWTHEGERSRRSRHLRSRVLARGCAEFATLDGPEARRRIELGLVVLERAGLHPVGFTPPGWLASAAAIDELRRLGFAYTTTHLTVRDLWHDTVIGIPAVSQRPGSPVSAVGAVATRRLGIHRIAQDLDLRIALHPADLRDERLVHATCCLLDAAACRDVITYAELVDASVVVPEGVA